MRGTQSDGFFSLNTTESQAFFFLHSKVQVTKECLPSYVTFFLITEVQVICQLLKYFYSASESVLFYVFRFQSAVSLSPSSEVILIATF